MSTVTLKTIANHFNVSTATVSKAINDLPGVSEELKKQIQQYVKERNYIPNSFGRGLKGKRLKVIGVIITDIANPIYAQSVQGLENEAEKRGYNIFLCNAKEKWWHEERQINALIQRAVDGVIIVPSNCDDEVYAQERFNILEKLAIPFVFMYRTIDKSGREYDYVKTDNEYGSYISTKYLLEKGHKKILYLTVNSNVSSVEERRQGYVKAVKESSLSTRGDIFICDDMTFNSAYDMTLNILKKRQDFTAISTANDMMAFGVISALQSKNIKVPDDIAVIGFDDNAYAGINLIPLTTIRQETDYIGKRAVTILIDKIEGKRQGLVQEVLKPALVERVSALAIVPPIPSKTIF